MNFAPARWAQLLALAVCIGIGIAFVYANVRSWELEDAQAYWNAALRLREGGDLYIAVPAGADEMVAYRYAPWLAWVWVPLTYLPKSLAEFLWSAVLIGSVVVALLPLTRVRSAAAVGLLFLLGGLMVRTASTGNVHALMIAALVWGVPRRSGPLWIGVAASLKVVPILYALVYAGRRQWVRAGFAVLVAAVLWAPALLFDLTQYPAEAGESLSLLSWAGPVPWLVAVGICVVAAVALARTRYAWPAASVAVLAAVPRLAFYDLTYLLVWRETESTAHSPDVSASERA
ncbi:MAG TPA: hypothetical protein VFK36_05770 [Gemmatimonadales bacterium]|nr:hypothetical protein [Gemmatimonadales bacterium]